MILQNILKYLWTAIYKKEEEKIDFEMSLFLFFNFGRLCCAVWIISHSTILDALQTFLAGNYRSFSRWHPSVKQHQWFLTNDTCHMAKALGDNIGNTWESPFLRWTLIHFFNFEELRLNLLAFKIVLYLHFLPFYPLPISAVSKIGIKGLLLSLQKFHNFSIIGP